MSDVVSGYNSDSTSIPNSIRVRSAALGHYSPAIRLSLEIDAQV